MPFIGKTPETGAFRLIDSITTSATDTYALTVQGDHYFPESARNLIVSLNGVTQAPETAYTVSGSHIVFASALTSSDVIDYILVIGDAVDIGTPSDGTVGDAQLKASLDLSGKTLTFSNDQISGDVIHGGTISNFASTGIDDNATSTAITIDSSQNVGLGGAPSEKLDVVGVGSFNGMKIGPNGTDINSTFLGASSIIAFKNNGVEAARFDNLGRLGINEYNPNAKLNVVSDVNPVDVDTYGSVIISSTAGSLGPRLNIASSSSTGNSYLWSVNRGYNVTNIVMQEHGGNVGVGTETINERLVSVGAIRALGATTSNEPSATLSWNGTVLGVESRGPDLSTRGKINLYQAASNGSLGQTALHIDASGNVVVGSTTANAAGAVTINQDGDITQVSASGVASSSLFGAISGVSNGFQIQSTTSNTHIYTLLNGPNVAMKIADGKVMVNTGTSSSNKKLIVAVDPTSTSDDGIQLQDPASTNLYGTLGLTGSAYSYRNVPANQIMLYGGGKGISFLTDGSPLPITFHDSTGEYARFNAQKFSLGATTTNSPFAVHTIRGQKAFCGSFVHNSSGLTTDILRLHSLSGNVTVGISIKLRACNAITNQYCIIEFHASAHRTGYATPTLSVTTPSKTVPINTAASISGGTVTWDSSTLTLKYTSSFSVSYWGFSVEADVMAHDAAGCTFLI